VALDRSKSSQSRGGQGLGVRRARPRQHRAQGDPPGRPASPRGPRRGATGLPIGLARRARLGLSSRPGVGASGVFEPRRTCTALERRAKGNPAKDALDGSVQAARLGRPDAGRRAGGMDAGAVRGFVDVDVAEAAMALWSSSAAATGAPGWRASASCSAAGVNPFSSGFAGRTAGAPGSAAGEFAQPGRRRRHRGRLPRPPAGADRAAPGHRALKPREYFHSNICFNRSNRWCRPAARHLEVR
jgi:hypothetical protein